MTATANGTSVAYTWGATSDGLTGTLNVCVNTTCTSHAVPDAGNYSGSSTATSYPAGQKETITAYVTDSSGQRAPATGTVTASATTSTPTPPPNTSGHLLFQLGESEPAGTGTAPGTCATGNCYDFILASNSDEFPKNTNLTYTCADSNGVWYGPGSQVLGGSTATNGSGDFTIDTYCVHAADGQTVTFSVTGGGVSGSIGYTLPAGIHPTLSVSQGAPNSADVTTETCTTCFYYVHLEADRFAADATLTATCTTATSTYGLALGPVASTSSAATATTQTSDEDAGGSPIIKTDNLGTSYYDSDIEWYDGFAVAGASLSCSVTDGTNTVTATYTTP